MDLGIAFAADGIALCRVRRRRGGIEVLHAGRAPLPEGALAPALATANLVDLDACRGALAGLLAEARVAREAVAVALPDPSVRVRTLPQVPSGGTADEVRRVAVWALRDALPVGPAEARIDVDAPAGAGGPAVCLLAVDAVVSQYETLLRGLGLVPTAIGASSLALLALTGRPRDDEPRAALVELPGYLAFLAVTGPVVRAWRCLPDAGEGTAGLAREVGDSLHALVQSGVLPAPPVLAVHAPGRAGLADALAREAVAAAPLAWPAGLPEDPTIAAAAAVAGLA